MIRRGIRSAAPDMQLPGLRDVKLHVKGSGVIYLFP